MSDEPARIVFGCEYCDEQTSTLEPCKMFNPFGGEPYDWWMLVCTNSDCGVKEPIEGEDFLGLLVHLFDVDSAAEAIEQTLRAVMVYRTQEVVDE